MIERSRIEFRFESGTILTNYSTNGTEEKPKGHNGSKTGTLPAFENIILTMRPYYIVLRTSETDIAQLSIILLKNCFNYSRTDSVNNEKLLYKFQIHFDIIL